MTINFVRTHDGRDDSTDFQPMERLQGVVLLPKPMEQLRGMVLLPKLMKLRSQFFSFFEIKSNCDKRLYILHIEKPFTAFYWVVFSGLNLEDCYLISRFTLQSFNLKVYCFRYTSNFFCTLNNLEQFADPRRSLKGWMFEVWRLLCCSAVTLLVNHSDYDIKFYVHSELFPGDGLKHIFTLCARTAKLIDEGRMVLFNEFYVETTVVLVSGLSGCRTLILTPENFKEFCELNFRVIGGNQLELYNETRRRRFTGRC